MTGVGSVVLKVWSPRPAASASPGNMSETQILRNHPSRAELWILGLGAAVWAVTSHLGNSDAGSCLRTIGLDEIQLVTESLWDLCAPHFPHL